MPRCWLLITSAFAAMRSMCAVASSWIVHQERAIAIDVDDLFIQGTQPLRRARRDSRNPIAPRPAEVRNVRGCLNL